MGDVFMILFVSIGLIGLGIYFIFSKKGVEKPERVMVEATVVDQVSETSMRDSDHPTHASTVSTYPIYEYMVDGKTYRARGTVGITIFTKERYKVGAKEMVRIDPYRPNRVYTNGEKNATAIIGVILVIFGVLGLVTIS